MPKILHEQTGLRIKKNDVNKVCVIELDFIADPLKRDPNWIREATAGMSKSQVRREYYRDYTALYGERTFPESTEYADQIIVKPPYPNIDSFSKFWAGFDYGTRNPSAFIVFGEGKNADGESSLFALWEHYEPTKDIHLTCDIIKKCEYFPFLRWIACDRNIWTKNQQTKRGVQGLTSVADLMIENGVSNIIEGAQNEESFITYVHTLWGDLANGGLPKFYIQDNCPNLIREFQNIVYISQTSAGYKNSSPKEQMINKDNHALDATKYFFSTYPGLPSVREIMEGRKQTSLQDRWKRHIK